MSVYKTSKIISNFISTNSCDQQLKLAFTRTFWDKTHSGGLRIRHGNSYWIVSFYNTANAQHKWWFIDLGLCNKSSHEFIVFCSLNQFAVIDSGALRVTSWHARVVLLFFFLTRWWLMLVHRRHTLFSHTMHLHNTLVLVGVTSKVCMR